LVPDQSETGRRILAENRKHMTGLVWFFPDQRNFGMHEDHKQSNHEKDHTEIQGLAAMGSEENRV
jgi:hypothetical protein